jgi:hypothetical protein
MIDDLRIHAHGERGPRAGGDHVLYWMQSSLRAHDQWTRTAAEALAIMEHLNNKYALDGRDPCTYLNLHWVLGKFDRPLYRRPIFGTVRSMSLRAAEKKFDVGALAARYA